MTVRFFSEAISFKLKHPQKTRKWILQCIQSENRSLDSLNYIFCNDAFLLSINQTYLSHDNYTDIITFEYAKDPIEGEIYISIDRVEENAKVLAQPFEEELNRVIIHGALHLIGYSDKTEAEKAHMRKKEEAYLSLRK